MDITIYLPDELGKWAKENDLNLSRMLREAVEAEKHRRDARAEISDKGFQRIEAYDGQKERDVAFHGRMIAVDIDTQQEAYLTAKGAIVITDPETLTVYGNWDELTEDPAGLVIERWPSEALMVQIAYQLGEKYVEELDI